MLIENGTALAHPALARLVDQHPMPGRSLEKISIVPPELKVPLQETQDWVLDLDDTTHLHPPEVTILRMPWFARWALSEQAVDPGRYNNVKPGTPEWEPFLEEIRTFSGERYHDPDYLFRLGVSWAYAIQSDTLRERLAATFDLPQDMAFWPTYNAFRRAANVNPDNEIVIAPGAADFLNTQLARQKRLHIISNSPPERVKPYADLMRNAGFNGEYTNVISATGKGNAYRKPHASSMRRLIKRLRADQPEGPIRISYVGNSIEDVRFTYQSCDPSYQPEADEATTEEMRDVSIVPVLITRGLDYSDFRGLQTCQFSSFEELAEALTS